MPFVRESAQVEMVGQLFFSCREIEVFVRFVKPVHPRGVFLTAWISPVFGLDSLAFESRLFIEAKSHAEVSIGCNEIGIEVLIGKIEGVSNVGEAMIVIIRREIFRKVKGQVMQSEQVTHGVAVFPAVQSPENGFIGTLLLQNRAEPWSARRWPVWSQRSWVA